MLTLRLPGQSIRWPEACACCLAPMTHTVTATRTKRLWLGIATIRRTLSVPVPYCETCSRHAEWASGSQYLALVLVVVLILFIAPIIGLIIAVSLPEGAAQVVAAVLLVLVAPLALAVAAGVRFWRRIPRPTGAEHSTKGLAVEISDFSKENVLLRVHNDSYGQSLAAANGVMPL
jgi:CBS domain containing-hemolysin-like protein